MGWARGSEFVGRIARVLMLSDASIECQRAIYNELVLTALNFDCDTLDECRGICADLDAAIDEHWGSYEDED